MGLVVTQFIHCLFHFTFLSFGFFFVISLGSFVLLYVLSHLLALFASYLVFKLYCYRHSIANFALLLVSVALRKYSCCAIKDMKLFTIPQTQKYMLPSAVELYRRRLFTLFTALTTAKSHKSQGGSRLCWESSLAVGECFQPCLIILNSMHHEIFVV